MNTRKEKWTRGSIDIPYEYEMGVPNNKILYFSLYNIMQYPVSNYKILIIISMNCEKYKCFIYCCNLLFTNTLLCVRRLSYCTIVGVMLD